MTHASPLAIGRWLLTGVLASALAGLVQAGDPALTSVTYPFGQGSGAAGITSADFDGDGDVDLATGNEFPNLASNNRLAIWSNDGTGVMSVSALLPLSAMPMDVATDDLDGDGHPDLVVAIFVPFSQLSVFLNDGQGGFPVRTDIDTAGIPTAVATGDLDGDGDVDLAFTLRSFIDHHIGVLLNDGNGGFPGAVTQYPIGSVGSMPNDVAIGDLDEDGLPELLGTASESSDVYVLPNRGGGQFGPADSYAVGQLPTAVVTGDLDGDGHLDVVVQNSQSTFLSVYFGDGSGALTPTTNPICCQPGIAMKLGDMDGDNRLDLVINLTPDTMTVLRNQGDGHFAPMASVPKGEQTREVTIADLDQDGDLDFATVNDFPLDAPTITVALSTIPQVWSDLGGGTSGVAGPPTLDAAGPLTSGSTFTVGLENAPASALMLAFMSFQSLPLPALGGTFYAHPAIAQFLLAADASGTFQQSWTWPAGIAPGVDLYLQFAVQDLSVPAKITLSNAAKGTTP